MKTKVVVEIPRGCSIKYEHNYKTNELKVDRILKTPYPFNYGYIPGIVWDDGDFLDAIVIGAFDLHPLSTVEVEPIAVVEMFDNDESDFKVVCRLDKGDKLEDYRDIIQGFLTSYKKGVVINGFQTSEEYIKKTLNIKP